MLTYPRFSLWRPAFIAAGPVALARERAAAQAAGIPLNADQLQRPLPPNGRNAAPLYAQVDTLRGQKPLHLPLYAQPLGGGRAYTPDQIAATEAQYLARMLPLIAAADQSGPARRAAFAANERDAPSSQSLDPMTALNAVFIPVFTKAVEKDDFIHAEEQVVMAAAAVLAVKAGTGAFPESLPGGFTDPFNGRPLGYRREGNSGFVVYSVGIGGTFNGGGPREYRFDPVQAFFRYPGPTPQPVPPDMLK